jgi:uncharacterized membrane protein
VPPDGTHATGPSAGEVVAPTREDPVVRAASEAVGGPLGRRAAPHPWWSPVRVVLAVACVAWALAFAQKGPCVADGWAGSARYSHGCYSDVPYLYISRGLAERVLPYTDTDGRYPDLEYPVLTGYFAYAAATVTQALNGWPDLAARSAAPADEVYALPGVEQERRDSFLVTGVLLAPFVLLAGWFLARVDPRRPWDAMGFAAAPVLVLAGLVNWDVLAVTCVAGALWAWARDRSVLAGVLVGLGVAVKLYPLFLLGAFLVVGLRERADGGLRRVARAVGAAILAWLAVNLPAMLGGWAAWAEFWRFNAARGADWGSLWLLAQEHGVTVAAPTINLVSAVAFACVCAGVLVLGLVAPRTPRVAQLAFLVTAGFLLVNKVYSPQYVLWLLPLAALARPRWRDLLVWQAGEAFYFAAIWLHLGGYTTPAVSTRPDVVYSLAIVVRVLAQLYLVVMVVRDVLRAGELEEPGSAELDGVERGDREADPDVDLVADRRQGHP